MVGGRAGDEWILFRDSTWVWPEPDSTNPIPLNWNAKNATQVVVGTIQGSGTPFLMRSAVVEESAPPPTSYPRWSEEELAGVVLNAPEDDADGDGIENVLEFAFGMNPRVRDHLPGIAAGKVTVGGVDYIQLAIPRRMDRVASLELQTSLNLVAWGPAGASVSVVGDVPSAWTLRYPLGLTPENSRRFFRVHVEPGS